MEPVCCLIARHLSEWGRVDLAGAARLEFVDGGVQLRQEDVMVEAMLRRLESRSWPGNITPHTEGKN